MWLGWFEVRTFDERLGLRGQLPGVQALRLGLPNQVQPAFVTLPLHMSLACWLTRGFEHMVTRLHARVLKDHTRRVVVPVRATLLTTPIVRLAMVTLYFGVVALTHLTEPAVLQRKATPMRTPFRRHPGCRQVEYRFPARPPAHDFSPISPVPV